MNQREALLTLQIAINRLATATTNVLNTPEPPDGNITISIGQNQEEVVILKNGAIVYNPGNRYNTTGGLGLGRLNRPIFLDRFLGLKKFL